MQKLIEKECHDCKIVKPFSEFHKNKDSKYGISYCCKLCQSIRDKKYYRQHCDESKYRNRKRNLKQYNLTLEQYDKIFKRQNGNCLICGLPELMQRLSVDHNHQTGKVRGLLCFRCNLLVGQIEKDSKLVFKILEYLNEQSD